MFSLTGQDPHQCGDRRQRDHGRYEHPGDPVGETLDRRLGRLCTLHERQQPRQRGVGADCAGLHDQRAVEVDRGAGDRRATGFLHRERFPGEHRLVDRRRALEHDAVDRDPVARAHPEQVSDPDLRRRDDPLAPRLIARTEQARRGVAQAGQLPHRPPRAMASAQIAVARDQERRDDRRPHVVVQAHLELADRHAMGVAVRLGVQHHRRVGEARQRAERDQRVHVRAAGPRAVPGRTQKRQTAPELDRHRQLAGQPPAGAVVRSEVGEQHDRDRQRDRERDPRQQGAPLRGLGAILLLDLTGGCVGHHRLGAVAGALDDRHQSVEVDRSG